MWITPQKIAGAPSTLAPPHSRFGAKLALIPSNLSPKPDCGSTRVKTTHVVKCTSDSKLLGRSSSVSMVKEAVEQALSERNQTLGIRKCSLYRRC